MQNGSSSLAVGGLALVTEESLQIAPAGWVSGEYKYNSFTPFIIELPYNLQVGII